MRIVVTGGNGGLGLETVKALARDGHRVVLACRDRARGDEAARGVTGAVEVAELDLASLASVRAFAERFDGTLDVLVNNAGVMAIPRSETTDGFEKQLGTNHLGHFALTALLWPRLRETPGARVVTVSSTAHKLGKMDFDDLMGTRKYSPWGAYGQSKLANLLFSFELARRIDKAGLGLRSVACHPGYANTNLQMVGPQASGSAFMGAMMRMSNALFAQSAEAGAWPTEFAALRDEAVNGSFIGPGGLFERAGKPKLVRGNARANDLDDARRLWDESEKLTGVSFAV
jgi:NAD(P)-dependent dehydrogenase (short-subunit alcohol dehydrogenase family)